MPRRVLVALKLLVHAACLAPFTVLLWRTVHDLTHPDAASLLGPDPTAALSHGTGFAALRLLVLSLAITPVRRLSRHLAWLIQFRRMLGLYAFFYACLHLLVYLKLYAGFDWSTLADDLHHRRYIIAGFAAWLLLLPLAATSTRVAIRRMGRGWQRLHRLVYAAAILGVVHYWWIVKAGVLDPVRITVALAAVLLARPAWALAERRRRARARVPNAATERATDPGH
jgi:sulfoxide reductase heme-binding subunit YedZ